MSKRIKASLFITCLVDQLYPDVGLSMVRVLQKAGVDVQFPEGQTCCGQPAFNSGFNSKALDLAHKFLDTFEDSDYVYSLSVFQSAENLLGWVSSGENTGIKIFKRDGEVSNN